MWLRKRSLPGLDRYETADAPMSYPEHAREGCPVRVTCVQSAVTVASDALRRAIQNIHQGPLGG